MVICRTRNFTATMADEVKEEYIPLDLNNAPEEEQNDRMLDGSLNRQEDEDEKSENEHHVGKDNSVYVSEIARGTSDEELQKAFEKCAPVKEAFVVRNKYTKETKGFGFVTFFNKEDMFKCIDWDTLPRFKDKQTGRMQVVKITPADPKNTLHIGNIPKNVTEEELKQHVLTYGKEPFEEFELCTDADGKPKGYAWVKFKDHDQALKTMKALKKGTFQGKVLYVSFAEPRVVDSRLIESVKSLFVKNVASSVNEAQLMTLFGGSVEKVVIPLDKKRRVPLGHAFVHFRSREEANDAMTQFNGYELEGRRLTIEWCIPQGVQRNQKKSTGKPVNYGMPYPPMPHHHNAPYPGYFYGYPPPAPLWPARANTHAHGTMPHHATPRPAQGMEHHHKAPAAYQGYDYWPSYGKPSTDRDQRGAYAAPQYGQYYAAYPPSSMMYPGYPPSSAAAAPSKSRYRPY